MAKFHVTWSVAPGRIVALAFPTEKARGEFIAANPGRTTILTARNAPKKAVLGARTPKQLEGRQWA